MNQMKSCCEINSDQQIVEKVMRTSSPIFDFIVVVIQESKYVKTMKIEELHSSLKAR